MQSVPNLESKVLPESFHPENIREEMKKLEELNPYLSRVRVEVSSRRGKLTRVLVANRGEIAKRFFLALREEGIRSVAVVTDPDRYQSWYEFADEVLYIGSATNYTSISTIVAASILTGADAVYPGYGFLSEDFLFVEALQAASDWFDHSIAFIGPNSSVMRKVGNKLDARKLASENGIPLLEGSGPITGGEEEASREAQRIGYPVIVKLDAGGGGKGMVVAHGQEELTAAIESAKRIGKQSYGNDTFYLEKFVERPSHFEVQIFNSTAVGVRKCAVQRRNQKVAEESGESFLTSQTVLQLLSSAEKIAQISGYWENCGAGTVEFLLDNTTGEFGFLEMNTRLQVEYAVTDQSLDIDLAKWQILLFDGREEEIPFDSVIARRFGNRNHSIQCRIYAEDPFQNYSPSPGKIQDLALPTFNGIRCDFGFRKGDSVLREYDPMIGKLIARGKDREEALIRMERALTELYIKGLTTNVEQLLKLVRHSDFQKGNYDNKILEENSELTKSDVSYLEEAALLVSVSEAIARFGKNTKETFLSNDLSQILYSEEAEESPLEYLVRSGEKTIQVRLFCVAPNAFEATINGRKMERVNVTESDDGGDDFLAGFGGRAIPVRVDRRPNFHLIRFCDPEGKIRFVRLTVSETADSLGEDPKQILRCPFNGTFVKLCENPGQNRGWQEGDFIQAGDPILVISAMKMETVLRSPAEGKISYLVEHGNQNKLIVGTTASGLILGKSLPEGSILLKLDSVSSPEHQETKEETSHSIEYSSNSIWDLWTHLGKDIADIDQGKAMTISSQTLDGNSILLKAWLLGVFREKNMIPRFQEALETIQLETMPERSKQEFGQLFSDFIKFSVLIRRLFSSDPGEKLSHFGEMQSLLIHWENPEIKISSVAEKLLTKTYAYYRRAAQSQTMQANGSKIQREAKAGFPRDNKGQAAFSFMIRAFHNLKEGRELFTEFISKTYRIATSSSSLDVSLHELLALEEREKDPELGNLIRKILRERGNRPQKLRGGDPTLSRKYVFDYIRFQKRPWSLLAIEPDSELERVFLDSFEKQSELLGKEVRADLRELILSKLEYWSGISEIQRLYSPDHNHLLYHIKKTNEYFLLSIVDTNERELIDKNTLELSTMKAASILQGAHNWRAASSFRLEMIAADPIAEELGSSERMVFHYDTLVETSQSVGRFFLHGNYSLFTFDILSPDRKAKKTLSLYMKNGKLCTDPLQEGDPRFPYSKKTSEKDSKLFQKGKWPLEAWVKESFDLNSFREIFIPGIDDQENDPKTDKSGNRKIGAKIFLGTIQGKEAVFFFKDSRVAGGATGDWEGRKYIASAYFAYRKDVPLFIWNDGAGANIREGMVALNRAAEGFFMNALLTRRVRLAEFKANIESHPDPVLREVCKNTEGAYYSEFRRYIPNARPKHCTLVAVGVGSSTGLDVYGSSQCSIQVLLDEKESYRVLTGSAVIESVTGEKFSNYEIGGARIMGQATGTVDLVATDKLQLVWYLQRIQAILMGTDNAAANSPELNVSEAERDILDEKELVSISEGGVFLPIKERYSASGSLISGLIRMEGTPILAMGPRTQYGFYSFASTTRAKESVVIAEKTGCGLLLVYGKRWNRSSHYEDSDSLRARIDFQNHLSGFDGLCVHFVKDADGIRIPELMGAGDLWILLDTERDSTKERIEARKVATFASSSEKECYRIAGKLFDLVYNREKSGSSSPEGRVEIPDETSTPYNMKENVIERVLDMGTFMELFEFHPGKSLVTGLGRLEGKTVAVIADQPWNGGAPDATGTEKFRIFTEFIRKFEIPLLMISDAPGFVPGTKQERLRIQQIGGESLDVNVLSQMPVVSVVLRQNYGGRQIHAFSGFLRPGISYQSFDHAILAVMGASSAFDLFQGKQVAFLQEEKKYTEIQDLREDFFRTFLEKSNASSDAQNSGVLDGLYSDFSQLREVLKKGLIDACAKVIQWKRLTNQYAAESNVASFNCRFGNEDWGDSILP